MKSPEAKVNIPSEYNSFTNVEVAAEVDLIRRRRSVLPRASYISTIRVLWKY